MQVEGPNLVCKSVATAVQEHYCDALLGADKMYSFYS